MREAVHELADVVLPFVPGEVEAHAGARVPVLPVLRVVVVQLKDWASRGDRERRREPVNPAVGPVCFSRMQRKETRT